MKTLGITVVLGLLVVVWAQVNVQQPLCDSPEAEEAALVALDYLNAQHTHGYKYALNRIEEIKVLVRPDGDLYSLEIDLLETDCHVLDPTPVANCTVRPKVMTAVEGDCDVMLKKVGGALTVIAFKCKTDESTEDLCLGCYSLLPLNDTAGLEFAHASLATFNNNTVNVTYTILEVGRISSQLVSGGPQYSVEYVIVEANCTDDACVPLNEPLTERGFCIAKGSLTAHTVDCKMFPVLMPVVDANSTAVPDPALPPAVHVFTGSPSHKHGLRHHKLTSHHDPHLSGLLSAESAESDEIVPIVPAVVGAAAAPASPDPSADPSPAADPAPALEAAPSPESAPAADAPAADAPAADSGPASDSVNSRELPLDLFKRDVAATLGLTAVDGPALQTDPILLVPACPGRVRFFK
ncbi:alpha-2-HS-glycoprotein-like [Seriola lalandi dorsalis]|uniref:Alpha-2-HS-glycoprotein 2 n=1 Tax=Seriola lalandi dorsalis TaxID=1841481 RepID=A0A3B4YGX6_SERLL|nr:alpha-2-HS-glycoprotein-like [Seriola lalandi dorsalis]